MRTKLSQACLSALVASTAPIVTRYQLQLIIARLYRGPLPDGGTIYRTSKHPRKQDYRRVVEQLIEEKSISRDRDFATCAYRIKDNPDAGADDICCIVDPLCYVSHLSAMEIYGLTDRIPQTLLLTTPHPRLWREEAGQIVAHDLAILGDDLRGFSPVVLRCPSFPETVRGTKVERRVTGTPAKSTNVRARFARVSAIGDTFADMLSAPELCGGMDHVLEVWQSGARLHLPDILAAISGVGSNIVKVRAGYILEERLKISDPVIDGWKALAQRGGSQRLDPGRAYAPKFSETWMLSINL